MAKKKADDAAVRVTMLCLYGEAVPGDVVEVDAEEAARLIEFGAALPVAEAAATGDDGAEA